ncbi:hypothetical protein [Pedobacter metabolipauper]|uniref:Carboxypeptidase family protein n=1 Tax=Pedobacter metabolipauper TaxID=425513 RepID=A0A4R6T043_9SPHI|nr:hypothetical protein [Pedobacter metabolipauper]TDQ11379.1 hypothetical protein ATK78_0497 [Pedobacter metabolipauper]
MKAKHLIILLAVLLTMSCEKPADQIFNGDAHISGTIYYENILTGSLDTAKTAKLVVTKDGIDQTNYVVQLKNGTFDLNLLSSGNYKFNITFQTKTAGLLNDNVYTLDTILTVSESQLLKDQNLRLNMETSLVANTALRLFIKDDQNAPLANVQVCLYSDAQTILKNRNTCVGNIRTGITNKNGVVLFDGLEERAYFAAAYIAVGKDTISNNLSDQTPLTILKKNTINETTIKLQTQVKPIATSLKITVTDQSGGYIQNAEICLYSDLDLIARYTNCFGSIKNGSSDAFGVSTFTALQPLKYYISAFKISGTDTLSNIDSRLLPTAVLNVNAVNTFNVVLKPQNKPQPPAGPTTLKINVYDKNGALIPNANVCLYSDPDLVTKYQACEGSLKSGSTDTFGSISFKDLQQLKYYVRAYKVVHDQDTLSNNDTRRTPTGVLIGNSVNEFNVVIK